MKPERSEDWGEQDAQGVDLSRLRFNLKLSDEEKLRQHLRAKEFILECMRAATRAGVPRSPEEPRR